MSNELWGVVIWGLIAITGSVLSTWLSQWWKYKRRRESISAIVKAEIISAKEMPQRYLAGQSTLEELGNATPLWKSMRPDIFFLSKEKAIAARRALTLHFELQPSGDRDKAQMCIDACKRPLTYFNWRLT
jgi:hypothetical protein